MRNGLCRRRHNYGYPRVKISAVPFWDGQRFFCQHAPPRARRHLAIIVTACRNLPAGGFTARLPAHESGAIPSKINKIVSSVNRLATLSPRMDQVVAAIARRLGSTHQM
jgi:hypothetical protein